MKPGCRGLWFPPFEKDDGPPAGGGGAQFSVAIDEPLMMIGLVEPELVRVAEPVTVESAVRLQVPDAVSVAVKRISRFPNSNKKERSRWGRKRSRCQCQIFPVRDY